MFPAVYANESIKINPKIPHIITRHLATHIAHQRSTPTHSARAHVHHLISPPPAISVFFFFRLPITLDSFSSSKCLSGRLSSAHLIVFPPASSSSSSSLPSKGLTPIGADSLSRGCHDYIALSCVSQSVSMFHATKKFKRKKKVFASTDLTMNCRLSALFSRNNKTSKALTRRAYQRLI
jgi:hypothetical protein